MANKFKVGDKVYLYRKIRPWDHGVDYEKDRAFNEKHQLTVNYIGCEKKECVEVSSAFSPLMTVFVDCLMLWSKRKTILCLDE